MWDLSSTWLLHHLRPKCQKLKEGNSMEKFQTRVFWLSILTSLPSSLKWCFWCMTFLCRLLSFSFVTVFYSFNCVWYKKLPRPSFSTLLDVSSVNGKNKGKLGSQEHMSDLEEHDSLVENLDHKVCLKPVLLSFFLRLMLWQHCLLRALLRSFKDNSVQDLMMKTCFQDIILLSIRFSFMRSLMNCHRDVSTKITEEKDRQVRQELIKLVNQFMFLTP